MPGPVDDSVGHLDSYEAIATDLQKLRFASGDIPYAEIVRRIAHHREQNGVSPAASRPARTTVYDAFRLGRSRVNPQLVGEIARALQASEPDVVIWEERCLQMRRQPEGSLVPVESPALAPVRIPDHPAPAESPRADVERMPKKASASVSLMLMAACIGINLAGFALVPWLGLPLYLDMVGTAIAALALGPWHGALVGLATNAIGLSITGSSSIAFALVNIVGALIWGYGVRRFRLGQSFPRYVLLNAIVAVSCTIVATTLLLVVFGGGTGHAAELTMKTLMQRGESPSLAVFSGNLTYSLIDKGLTGFISLAALGGISRWFDVPVYESLVGNRSKGARRPDDGPGDQ